jgi:hypothetical protein
MSGLVSDESAVGIGHYLGAKIVVTGAFDRFANFSQFRIRAIDVESARILAMYSARIDNRDAILADVTQPLANTPSVAITENALARLNRGKDFFTGQGIGHFFFTLPAFLLENELCNNNLFNYIFCTM